MIKIDLKKDLARLYKPSAKEITIVDVPGFSFITVDGQGSPESMNYQDAVQALYSVAYAIKFSKKADGIDFGVMPLEGLWWAEDMSDFDPETGDRNAWRWTMMIMQPDFVTREDFASSVAGAGKKKDLPALDAVKFTRFEEGTTAQILHIGRYLEEGPNIRRLHETIAQNSGTLSGKHHEIYLSDPRRTDPAKLKTILRQPYTIS